MVSIVGTALIKACLLEYMDEMPMALLDGPDSMFLPLSWLHDAVESMHS